MKFGYSTNAFVKFTVAEAVEKIAELGFSGVEIMCDKPHLYPPDFDGSARFELVRLIREKGLAITNLNSFTLFAVGDTYLPSWIEPDRERREIRIRHTLESLYLARDLGCPFISVPPGGPCEQMDRREALLTFHRGIEKVVPLAESLGITILIEPEPGLLLENTAQFKSFIRDVGSPAVGLNFDIGHFFCVGENPAAAFAELAEWARHVHIEDIAASRVHEHLIPGRGAIRFREVLTEMVRARYPGDITLELYPYVDTPVPAGRESLAFLRPLMAEAGFRVEGPKENP